MCLCLEEDDWVVSGMGIFASWLSRLPCQDMLTLIILTQIFIGYSISYDFLCFSVYGIMQATASLLCTGFSWLSRTLWQPWWAFWERLASWTAKSSYRSKAGGSDTAAFIRGINLMSSLCCFPGEQRSSSGTGRRSCNRCKGDADSQTLKECFWLFLAVNG